MSRIDVLLEEARSLSNAERRQLAERLLQSAQEAEAEEVAVGDRGLAALTESMCSEDWSPYYPGKLRQTRD